MEFKNLDSYWSIEAKYAMKEKDYEEVVDCYIANESKGWFPINAFEKGTVGYALAYGTWE